MNIRDEIHKLNDRETRDLALAFGDALVGDFLGGGTNRIVYELYSDKTGKVVKIDTSHGHISNVLEYEIWEQFKETKEGKKWLAESFYLSSCSKILTQEKLLPIVSIDDKRLPTRIPRWLTDTKIQNWGVDSKGRVKCLDYGFPLLLQNNPWQLKKAEWWSL